MVEGIIRLHGGEDVLEEAIEECNMFLGLGIVKKSQDDEKICSESQYLYAGGAGLNNKLIIECLASFVIKTLSELSKRCEPFGSPRKERALALYFLEDFNRKLAARMGADVPEEKTASIMINVGGGMEEAIRIMEAMAKAKEGKR